MEKVEKNRFIIILTLILIILLVNTIRSILSNRESLDRLANERKELTELIKTNDKLKEDIEFVQSDEYKEKIALEQLNMTKPGYKVVVLEESPTIEEQEKQSTEMSTNKEKPYILWLRVFNIK